MDNNTLMQSLRQIAHNIRSFIDLSINETNDAWDDLAHLPQQTMKIRCWEIKQCTHQGCPVYKKDAMRCWLIAGTMCGGAAQGVFASKYKSCTECEVYQATVFQDPVVEINEHLITLVHSLRLTQQKLMARASRDPLTGVYNRSYFNEIILNEVHRTERYGTEFSIIMLDVDNFKRVNDTYGHLEGDRVLKDCASMLNRCIRASDLLVRFGGDEFLIVTPETDSRNCDALRARIDQEIATWNMNNANHALDRQLSLSIGCATFHSGANLSEVIKDADARMFSRKAENKRKTFTCRNRF